MFILRFIERWVVRLLLLALILGVGIYFAKDRILKYYIDVQLSKETGLSVQVEKVHLDVIKGVISANNIEIYHPTIMNNLMLAQVPQVEAKVGLWGLVFKKLEFDWVEVNIAVFQSVESATGVSTEVYMRKLAENINLKTGPWLYEGIDNLYVTIVRHQKVGLEKPDRIKTWNELNVNRMCFKDVETPREFVEVLNGLLYGNSSRLRV